MRRRRYRGPCVVALAATSLTACGSSGGSTAPVIAPPRPTTTAQTTAKAGTTTLKVADFKYRPAVLTVAPGTKVTWINEDAANHTVTFADKNLGNLDTGGRVARTFAKAGRFAYVCQYHPFMKGRVVVA